MADALKTVSDKATLLTTLSLGVAIGAGSVYVYDSKTDELNPVQLAEEVRTNALLDAATEECRAEVMEVGDNPGCVIGYTTMGGTGACANTKGDADCQYNGDADRKVEGWICNGAFMPQRIQDCLDAALTKLNQSPKKVGSVNTVPR